MYELQIYNNIANSISLIKDEQVWGVTHGDWIDNFFQAKGHIQRMKIKKMKS